jgi:hypothetical protein
MGPSKFASKLGESGEWLLVISCGECEFTSTVLASTHLNGQNFGCPCGNTVIIPQKIVENIKKVLGTQAEAADRIAKTLKIQPK